MLRQIITLRSSLMKVRPSRPISIRFMADVVAEKDVLPTSTSLPSVPPKPLSFIDSLKSVAKSREEFKGFKVAGWVSGTLFVTYVLPIWTIYRTLTNQMETITTDIAALKNQMSVKDLAAEINLQNTRIENAMKLMDKRHQDFKHALIFTLNRTKSSMRELASTSQKTFELLDLKCDPWMLWKKVKIRFSHTESHQIGLTDDEIRDYAIRYLEANPNWPDA
eukprot:TRINITY_DN3305_c0_g1_i7.p1 TRINITY_DN3305_c0_g1~~TRINITY_DN3305_c0_g1_i7.p1  ORF type:complete len:221 (-),score=37.48 TRINITY_DN3305_c0_g1_i7:116-778(-)